MKRTLLMGAAALLVALLAPALLAAYDGAPFREGGAGVFLVGYTGLDIKELNSELKANGFKAFDTSDVSFGGGGYGIIGGRLLVGGEGHGFGQEAATSTYTQRLAGGYGLFDVGYMVVDRGGFRVFPMIGVGGGSMSLRLTERNPLDFGDIMTTPSRESFLETGGFMLQGSIGVDYFIRMGEDEEGVGGFIVGVRAGYVHSFWESKWKMGPADLSGGPDVGISGFFVRFAVGGGGYSKRSD